MNHDIASKLTKVANEHPETRAFIVPLLKRDKIAGVDPIIQQIGKLIKGKKLVDLRGPLETMFPKKAIDFTFMGGAHFTIKYKGKKIVLVNKKYVDDPELVVDDIAIGYI